MTWLDTWPGLEVAWAAALNAPTDEGTLGEGEGTMEVGDGVAAASGPAPRGKPRLAVTSLSATAGASGAGWK